MMDQTGVEDYQNHQLAHFLDFQTTHCLLWYLKLSIFVGLAWSGCGTLSLNSEASAGAEAAAEVALVALVASVALAKDELIGQLI